MFMHKRKLALLMTFIVCAAVLAFVGVVQAQARATASLDEAVAELHAILGSAGTAAPGAGAEAAANAAAQPDVALRRLLDGDEFMTVSVPAHWRDSASGTWIVDGQEVGRYITAAPDLAAFRAGSGPGVFFGAAPRGAAEMTATADQPAGIAQARGAQRLDAEAQRFAACARESARPYGDAFYAGAYDIVTACQNDRGQQRIHIEATPLTGQVALTLRAVTVTPEDRAALAQVLYSFQVLDPSFSDRHGEDEHGH
jgi:hypothetical protein